VPSGATIFAPESNDVSSREPLGAEIAFGVGDEEGGIAAGADNTNAHGLGPSAVRNNPSAQRQRHAREQVWQPKSEASHAGFSPVQSHDVKSRSSVPS
jgi:hypothetical protein